MYLQKAVSIFKKCFDPAPRLARSKYVLSEVLKAKGCQREACEMREEAEDLRRGIKTLPYEEESSPAAFERLVPYFFR